VCLSVVIDGVCLSSNKRITYLLTYTFDRQTDGRTTDRILIARPRLHFMQRVNKTTTQCVVSLLAAHTLQVKNEWHIPMWNNPQLIFDNLDTSIG